MEVLRPRCAALDVHKDTVVAAIRSADGSAARREMGTFATATPAALSVWLDGHACTHVAREAASPAARSRRCKTT